LLPILKLRLMPPLNWPSITNAGRECLLPAHGQKLQDKMAKIVIQYKKPSALYFPNQLGSAAGDHPESAQPAHLKVQPREGVVFQFNIKKPATTAEIVPVEMDFCQPCAFLINTPEAYERLLADAMSGDPARFSSWDEVECSWRLTDGIYKAHQRSGKPVSVYEPGSLGPATAVEMLNRQGCRWWD
jgi:glucose-6-phosphate 1-dehydrogenase